MWGPWDNGVDELLAQFDSSRNATYALTDASGDIVALCDTGGVGGAARVVAQFTYDAYGSVSSAEYLEPHGFLKCGHKGLFFERFDAGVYDADYGEEIPRLEPFARGLYYVRNRWLDPTHGRWLQSDPNGSGQLVAGYDAVHGKVALQRCLDFTHSALFASGQNISEYTRSSPMMRSDPSGLFDFSLAAQIGTMAINSWDMAEGMMESGRMGVETGMGYAALLGYYQHAQELMVDWALDWSQPDTDPLAITESLEMVDGREQWVVNFLRASNKVLKVAATTRAYRPQFRSEKFASRKDAYEQAKRRCAPGQEPVLHGPHPNQPRRFQTPHYHPVDAKGKIIPGEHFRFPLGQY